MSFNQIYTSELFEAIGLFTSLLQILLK